MLIQAGTERTISLAAEFWLSGMGSTDFYYDQFGWPAYTMGPSPAVAAASIFSFQVVPAPTGATTVALLLCIGAVRRARRVLGTDQRLRDDGCAFRF